MVTKFLVLPVIMSILLLVGLWKIFTKILGILNFKLGITSTWSKSSKQFHLHVIPYSHFCEKARLALDLCKIDYVEHDHPPVLHMFSTLYHSSGNSTSTPLLVTDKKEVIQDSGDILKMLNDSGNSWLYPNFKEVRSLEEYFDKNVGVHLRRWCYYQLSKYPKILGKIISKNIDGIYKPITNWFFFPIFLPMMLKGMNINKESSQKSFEKVCEALEKASEILSDGRKNFLETETYSAADLTFATLMYVVTCPPSMENVCTSAEDLSAMDGVSKEQFEKIKNYPAFDYALKVHQDLRGNTKINLKK
jgi:glutathione S-transferase